MSRGISISGDVVAGQAYIARAQHLLDRLAIRAATSKLPVLREYERLNDSAYCYAMLAGGTSRAVIVVDGSEDGQSQSSLRETYAPEVPDFYSGTVIGGTLGLAGETEKLSEFSATQSCASLFSLEAGTALFKTRKLAVTPFSPYVEVLGSKSDSLKFSQYVNLKPTMYSGTMRKVVQLLMGFGRQLGKKSLYDTTPTLPLVEGEKPKPSKYQRDVAANGLQIRFDWRWFRTHGVSRATDGKLWLVEIGNVRGVIAMRLPVHKLSSAPEFREKLERLDDKAGLLALDDLGAFPTGEAFPAGDIEPWIRAGRVIRLAERNEMNRFYENLTYSSCMGWAFNSAGTEAHNTCYRYEDDFVQTGLHFCFKISIGESQDVEPKAGAKQLIARIQKLEENATYRSRFPAVAYKINHMTEQAIAQIQTPGQSREALFEALDLLTLAPPAIASGSLSVAGQGRLFYPSKIQPHLKFPEPELGYLLTHDMSPGMPVSANYRCDTTVMVFFVDDQLKWVKFFNDPRPSQPVFYDESEECMYVGSWSKTRQVGPNIIPPSVYTNDFDDRKRLAGSTIKEKFVSEDLGYIRVIYNDDVVRPYEFILERYRGFRKSSERTIINGEICDTAVTMPFHDRCAYYYSVARGSESELTMYSTSYDQLIDPYFCNGWRNLIGFTGFATTGCTQLPQPNPCWQKQQHPAGCGPVTHRAVTASNYASYPCSEYADNGPWCFTCQNAEDVVYNITLPELVQKPSINKIGKSKRTTTLVSGSVFSPLLVENAELELTNYTDPWFLPSPHPETGATQYLDVTHNALGDATALRFWMLPNDGPVIVKGSPKINEMDSNATTFVGVV